MLLIADHGPDAHAAFLGAMLAGCAPAFLPQPSAKQDHASYWAQHRIVFQFARAALVIAPDALLAEVAACAEGSGTRAVALSISGTDTGAIEPPPGDAVALLQHSSGTTGLKKGVALTYDAIAAQLAAYAPTLGDTRDMRVATWLPLYHDMGLVSSFLLPMWLGAPIVSLDPFVWISAPRLMLDAIAEHRATHAWMPNFAFLVLARAARGGGRRWDLSSVRALISCSEPCKPAAMATFQAAFAPHGLREGTLSTCYAMAETVFAVSQSVVGQPVRALEVGGIKLLSNGKPVPGATVRVVRDGAPVPDGEVGELQIAAPFLFRGYHNNPVATGAAFDGEWYRSGDLGCLDGGEVFVTGRLKDVIIVQGRNVMAHDVEAAVSRVAGVKPGRCVAFGRYNERHGSEELVVVAERDGSGADPVRAIGDAVMADTGVACGDIRMVDPGWLVKTSSGKTSRGENARKYADMDPVAVGGFEPPTKGL